MPRTVLIVANRSIGGDALAEAITQRLASEPCHFHLLVPVPVPVSPVVAIGAAAADMTPTACFDLRSEREAAQERLDFGIEWLSGFEATATGELSIEGDTAVAVGMLVEKHPYDEVIVSTLPTVISRWLHQDLPHRIGRKVSVPVTVITPT
ncbi:MAG: hypothetical protein WBP59_10425 [Ilumatobacteraceae bacterium]